MNTFISWMLWRDVPTLLRLLEHADFFRPAKYNAVFDGQLDGLLARIESPTLRKQVGLLRGQDWASYIMASIKRAGFGDEEVEENFHGIVVRLLVSPGKLFKGWDPEKHGPLDRRFRRSVWNAIRNVVAVQHHHRQWMTSTDPNDLAARHVGRQSYSDTVEEFRSLVQQKLGRLATAILDCRLAGKDTKELIGRPEAGSPTAYAVKREVQSLKAMAYQFASDNGDPVFLATIQRLLAAEAETVVKRKQAVAARQASGVEG